MTWLLQYWPVLVVAVALIGTWAKMTSKMGEWDKIIPNLATKDDVQKSIDASIAKLQIDLLQGKIAEMKENDGGRRAGDK